MDSIKKLSEDKRLHKKISIESVSTKLNFVDSIYREVRVRLRPEKNRFKFIDYYYSISERQIFKIMDTIAYAEMSVWIKQNNSYILFPQNDFAWIHTEEPERAASKIACDLWECLDKYPDLKDKLVKPNGFDGPTNPVPFKDLPKEIQDYAFSLADIQTKMEVTSSYPKIEREEMDEYSIELIKSKNRSGKNGYGWTFFKRTNDGHVTHSSAGSDNAYVKQKDIEEFLKKNKDNSYFSENKTIRSDKRDIEFNDIQKLVSGLKLNYSVKKIEPFMFLEHVLREKKIDFFFRDRDEPFMADITLRDCTLGDFLDRAFSNCWSVSPDGILILGLPYPGAERFSPLPSCLIKYYPPEDE
jgi:hypothetical protein